MSDMKPISELSLSSVGEFITISHTNLTATGVLTGLRVSGTPEVFHSAGSTYISKILDKTNPEVDIYFPAEDTTHTFVVPLTTKFEVKD